MVDYVNITQHSIHWQAEAAAEDGRARLTVDITAYYQDSSGAVVRIFYWPFLVLFFSIMRMVDLCLLIFDYDMDHTALYAPHYLWKPKLGQRSSLF